MFMEYMPALTPFNGTGETFRTVSGCLGFQVSLGIGSNELIDLLAQTVKSKATPCLMQGQAGSAFSGQDQKNQSRS